jgi:hypothetical protein
VGAGTFSTSQFNGTTPLTVGQVYTTNTTSGSYNWTNPTTLGDNILTVQNNPASLDVKGRMILNGKDLEERLDTIEKVLQIPERDVKLEKKHPKLKKLYDEYIQALGKYRTFEAIKGDE